MKKHILRTIALLLALSAVLSCAAFAVSPTEKESLPQQDDYIELNVNMNGKSINDIAYTIKGNVYVNIDTLKAYGNTTGMKYENKSTKLYLDLTKLNLNIADEETTNFIVNNAADSVYLIVKNFEDGYWISLGSVAQFAGWNWYYYNGTVYITSIDNGGSYGKTITSENSAASLRNENSVLYNNQTVTILKETTSFYKVEDKNGNVFYVNKEDVSLFESASDLPNFEYIAEPKDTFDKKINLVWYNLADSATRTNLAPEANDGIDILAPVWFHMTTNGNGAVKQICDYGFVQLAHENGFKVWACINNCFSTSGSTAYTTKVLNSESLSNKVIAQYLFYAAVYNLDGLNLDYEDLTSSDKTTFAEFSSKLGYYCNKMGLTYSVDTYTPVTYNDKKYDWAALAESADYIIPMAYNETGATSTIGSVSSYPWYTKWTDRLASIIPSEKILLGMPMFTRWWNVDENNNVISPYKENTGTISMATLNERIAEYGATKTWDESKQQYFIRYRRDNRLVACWIEDETSINLRIEYVKNANLAGTACWAYDQAEEGIWNVFANGYSK